MSDDGVDKVGTVEKRKLLVFPKGEPHPEDRQLEIMRAMTKCPHDSQEMALLMKRFFGLRPRIDRKV